MTRNVTHGSLCGMTTLRLWHTFLGLLDAFWGLLDAMHKTRKLAETNMMIVKTRGKLYYDGTGRRRTFVIGDKVMLLQPTRQNRLEVLWEGPAGVVQELSETYYAVKLPDRRQEVYIYHCNLMKPYR